MAGLKLTPGAPLNAPRQNVGFAEAAGVGFSLAQQFEELSSRRRIFETALEPMTEFIRHNRTSLGDMALEAPSSAFTFRALDRLRENGVAIPDALDIGRSRFESEVIDGARAEYTKLITTLERTTGPGTAGAFIGQIAAGLDDIETVATLPFGAAARTGVAGTMLIEGALGGGTEVVANRNRAGFIRELGGEVPSDIEAFAIGAGTTALLAGGLKGLQVGGRRVVDRIGAKRSAKALEREAKNIDRPDAAIAARQVLDDIEAFESSRVARDPAARAEYGERVAAVSESMDAARPLEVSDAPKVAHPVNAEPVLARDETILLRPADILLEPEKFQFKSDADALGRTSKLMEVSEWRPERAGIIIVYENLDGTRSVADGHQRVNLARRIMEQDPSQDIRLRAFVLREADGVTVEQARVISAMKNISEAAEGLTAARAKDAAKILRAAPEEIANLPAGPGIRRARELAALSDDAFGMFVNEVVPERFAASVGRLAASRPELHASLMGILERTAPQTTEQAESIISQALASPVRVERETTLFGDEEMARSLFTEKAKVLERALALLRRDRQVFGTLVRDQARIEAQAGNRLASDQNAAIRSEVDNAIFQIQKLAHRRGEIGDALSAAAERFAGNGRLGDAAESVAESVRAAIRTGGLGRSDAGGPGRAPQLGDSVADVAEPGVQDGSANFAELGGEGQRAQGEVVMPRRLLDQDPPAEAFEPELAHRNTIGDLLDQGADRATLDGHPVVVAALDRMDQITETSAAEGYGSDSWHTDRVYKIDGEDVTGTAAALPRFVERARRLAATDGVAPHRGVTQGRKLTVVLGPPASGKSVFSNELAHANRAAIIDSDDIKRTLPEFEGGIGANAVHEESVDLSDMVEGVLRAEGSNVIYPKVGGKTSSTAALIKRFRNDGYSVEIVNVAVTPENAYLRMMRRFVKSGRLIPPAYMDAVGGNPSLTFRDLLKKGLADGFAEIDNNGTLGAPHPVSVAEGENPLAGSAFDLGGSGRAGNLRARQEPGAPATPVERDRAAGLMFRPRGPERAARAPAPIEAPSSINPRDRATGPDLGPDGGDQLVIPGAERISDEALMRRITGQRADAPLRGGDAEPGGLFAERQDDLFDSVPVVARLDDNGEMVVDSMSARELQDELDAEDNFFDDLEVCI